MATERRTIDYLLEQADRAGAVTIRPMFGEYGCYLDGKLFGVVCDDQLYLKPTPAGRDHAAPVAEAPPYPGAKPHLLVEADRWENADWLGELIRVTAAELPAPRAKRGKQSAT